MAVALGNWLASVDELPEEAVAALRDAVENKEPLVREHWSVSTPPTRMPAGNRRRGFRT